MCGIVGYVGERRAADILLDCLRRLEYRGYDSAGVAVVDGGRTQVVRRQGKLAELEAALAAAPLAGRLGIGHTRWATHGPPSERNAHPHQVNGVALVHNGIVENYLDLRRELVARGCELRSDTDSEIIAQLVAEGLHAGLPLAAAMRVALSRVRGSFAIAAVCEREPDRIVAARQALPLVVGVGDGESLLASDVSALLGRTREAIDLEDGDIAVLTRGGVEVESHERCPASRPPRSIQWTAEQAERGGYPHFMLKEIHEQPRALRDLLGAHVSAGRVRLGFGEDEAAARRWARSISRVVITACGTSWHAGMAARSWLEQLARVPCEVDWAHELRYRDPVVDPSTLVIAVSQSGETADTLAAARELRARGAPVWAICNVPGASLTRSADRTLHMNAGPEIGVASTKTYLSSLALLHLLALELGRLRGTLTDIVYGNALGDLAALPQAIEQTIELGGTVLDVAQRYRDTHDFLFLGRGRNVATALEGALKLKELAYAHAEGYAAGEMKHGPIALLDGSVPVVVVAPRDDTHEKVLSNLIEARARGAPIVAVCERDDRTTREVADELLPIPSVAPSLTPFVATVPLQLFAYHVANLRGLDVDKPRNLAKSVTVE